MHKETHLETHETEEVHSDIWISPPPDINEHHGKGVTEEGLVEHQRCRLYSHRVKDKYRDNTTSIRKNCSISLLVLVTMTVYNIRLLTLHLISP